MASTTNVPSPLSAIETGVYLPRVPTTPLLDTTAIPSKASEPTSPIPGLAEFAWNDRPALVEVLSGSARSSFAETQTDFNNQAIAIEDVLAAKSNHRSSTVLESLEESLDDSDSNLSWLTKSLADEVEQVASSPLYASCSLSQIPTTSVWGLDFHCVNMQQALDGIDQIVRERKPTFAVTANLNYAMLCAQHPRLKEFTRKAALVLCDGMPILWRSKTNKNQLPERVAGSDLIYQLAERSAKTKLRIYLYGAAEGVALKAANELARLYPGCNIVGVQCPPFRATSEAEVQLQIAQIQQAKPDVLLVALGQPKGEYWIEDNLQRLNVPLSIQVGASFDFVAGNAQRAPKLWQRLGGEWLYRMLKDPKRLAPRYFKNAVQLLKFLHRDCIDWLDSDSSKNPSAKVSTTSQI